MSTAPPKRILNILGRGAAQTKMFTAQSSTNLAQTNDTGFNSIGHGGGAPVSTAPPKRVLNTLGRGAAQTKMFTAQSSTNLAQTNDTCFIAIRGGGGAGDMHLSKAEGSMGKAWDEENLKKNIFVGKVPGSRGRGKSTT